MSLFQPNDAVELTRRNEKRLNRLERRANFGGQVSGLTNRGLDNLIINGDFRINQRGYVSGATLIPGRHTGYGHDRWRSAGRTNLAPNPRAFTTSAPWSGSNVTVSRITGISIPALPGVTTAVRTTATAAGSGGPYTQGDITGANAAINIVGGQKYRVSVWLRSSVAKTIQSSIQWAGAGGPSSTNHGTVALAANVWTEVTYTFTAPDLATRAGLYWYTTTALTVGQTIDATGLIVTEGTDVVPFFDANTPGCTSTGTIYQTPSINRPVVTSYTFTQAPNGCIITINSGGAIQQVIERANLPTGDYALSWEGTAQARVYKNSDLTLLGSSAASPLTFTTDGTDDIMIEFEAVGGAATLSEVSLVAGAAAYPFHPRPIGKELSLAQRYYWRMDNPADSTFNMMVCNLVVYTTTEFYGLLPMPVTMREVPLGRSDSHLAFMLFYQAVNTTSAVIGFQDGSPDTIRVRAVTGGSSTIGYSAWAELRPSYWIDFTAEF